MARDYGSKKKNLNKINKLVLGYQPNAAVVTTNEKCLEQQHIQISLIRMCLGTQVPPGGLYLKCGCNMRKITNIFDSPQTVDFPQH